MKWPEDGDSLWAFSGPPAVDDRQSVSLAKQSKGSRDLQTGRLRHRTPRGLQVDVGFTWVGASGLSFPLKAELAGSGESVDAFFLHLMHVPGKGQGLCVTSLLRPVGKRWSAACAYLHPALNRSNLKAEVRTFVSRVLFEGTRAVGVEYVKNGQSHRVSDLPASLGSSDGRKGVGSGRAPSPLEL